MNQIIAEIYAIADMTAKKAAGNLDSVEYVPRARFHNGR